MIVGGQINRNKKIDNGMKLMKHGKKGSKAGYRKEMFFKMSVSLCISMYYYSVMLILGFKLDIIIKLICR